MREVKEMMSSEVGCRVERRLQPNAGKEGSGPPGEALITICPGLRAPKNNLSRPWCGQVGPQSAEGRDKSFLDQLLTIFGPILGGPGEPGEAVLTICPGTNRLK